jgi:hypothetical protein
MAIETDDVFFAAGLNRCNIDSEKRVRMTGQKSSLHSLPEVFYEIQINGCCSVSYVFGGVHHLPVQNC